VTRAAARYRHAALLAMLLWLELTIPGSFPARAGSSVAQPALTVAGPRLVGLQGATAPATPLPLWTRYWQVRVRRSPAGPILTELDQNQEVRGLGLVTAPDGTRWRQIRLWGALDGYVEASLLAEAPQAVSYLPGVAIAPHPVGPHAPMPLRTGGITVAASALRRAPDAGAPMARLASAGTTLTISAWATDAQGRAWYRLLPSGLLWIAAGQVRLVPGRGTPDLAPFRGTGMWLTPSTLKAASPEAIVAAARQNHITHLYVEVGGRTGFYGGPLLDRIVPAAHRAHIAVLAWVYPFLDDLPMDVGVALAAARYVTPSGERPDGLAADVEQNMAQAAVRAYGQIVRARLGPHVPMAIAVYPPQSYWGKNFPYRVAAQSWDVIAPMDYWHVTRRPYSQKEAAAYVAASIDGIRAATGSPAIIVEPVGQMYDAFSNGRQSPTAAEIRGAIGAAQHKGASGISFFEWNHATPEEWDALQGVSPF
jgi:hypothetical protein